jgi:transposase
MDSERVKLMIIDDYPDSARIRQRYELLKPVLDERLRRLWAATEALAFGTGGISKLAEATGLSRNTIRSGIAELQRPQGELAGVTAEGRTRRRGAGRKKLIEKSKGLADALDALMESREVDAEGPLIWTCKSTRTLAEDLSRQGYKVSYKTVAKLLHDAGYTFSDHRLYGKLSVQERQERFQRISRAVSDLLDNGEPVLVLSFSRQDHHPIAPDLALAHLAGSAVHYWWQGGGNQRYPRAQRMLLLSDTSGDPVNDQVIWEHASQFLAKSLGMSLTADHLPPGARKWRTKRYSRLGFCRLTARNLDTVECCIEAV